MQIFLKHTDGKEVGKVETFEQDKIRVGRRPDNDLKFDPQTALSVSGYHAEIYCEGGVFFIKDLQSRNGTYLNSRKIDQLASLKDGDVLQFSSIGPKLAFSIKDVEPEAGTERVDAEEEMQRTQIFEAPPQPEKKTKIWEKIRPHLPIASLSVAAIASGLVGYHLGYSWWSLLIGAAVIALVGGAGYLGWRYWQRRKALKQQKAAAGEAREASSGRSDTRSIPEIKRKWVEVTNSLRESKLQRHGEDAMYAFPWFLFLGETGCGKSALIKVGGPLSSVVSQGQDGPTRNCDWWFFEKLVLLDTSGRYALADKDEDSAGGWNELMNLLRSHRRNEPINGVIVGIAADSLASRSLEQLKEQAAQLRQRLDEMVQRLGVKFPVYLAITKCDLIAGFSEFFAALPEQDRGQALGHVNSDMQNTSDGSRFFDRVFHTICERAERIRLGLFVEHDRADDVRGLFLFPAEIKSLRAPLKSFVDVLFRPSPYRDAPFFRGLFFASARQAGEPVSRLSRLLTVPYAKPAQKGTGRELFVRDLFSIILANDRALVGSTALGRERFQLARAAGLIVAIAACLLLCGLFALSFTNNWLAMKRLNIEPCVNSAARGNSISQALWPLDDCRQSIDDLRPRSIWKSLAFSFGLGHAQRVGNELRQKFLTAFAVSVLNPLDASINQSLSARSDAPLLVGVILQRMQVLTRCLADGQCPEPGKWQGPNYRVMLSAQIPQTKAGDPTADRLKRTHQAFIIWQPDAKSLEEMRGQDLDRIKRWRDSGGLRQDAIVESAKNQFEAIRISEFFAINSPAQVNAAYTDKAWKEGIEPLISGLQTMVAETKDGDMGESLKNFTANYRAQALRQWGEFLTEVAQVDRSAGQRGGLEMAKSVVGANSSYDRIITSAHANLSAVLSDSWQGSDLPPWAASLKKYVELKDKVITQKSGKEAPQEGTGKAADAAKFLAAYLSAISQIRAEISTPEKSFASAKKAFEEGEAGSNATHPVLKADWALGMLRDAMGAPQGDDRLLWLLLARPITLSWKALLEESGKHLQHQWEGLLLEVKELDSGSKGSKVLAFVNGSAAVFLTTQRGISAPKRILDQGLPFTDAFIQYHSRLRRDATSGITLPAAPFPGPPPPPYIARVS